MEVSEPMLRVNRAHYMLQHVIESELALEGLIGVKGTHCMLMMTLYGQRGGMTMQELAHEIDRSKSTVTQVVEVLIRKGWVQKKTNPQDRRFHKIDVSEEGLKVQPILDRMFDRLTTRMFRGFVQYEREELMFNLERIIMNLEEI
jgi:DNA-binding MarR family transcriptional regulator